ncbi:hypothetical protein IEZ26_13625 [Nocardioides cavernae]|uniref:Uncharacterized protein n=1 Tax=Nocardioides cavernae TaxID=1921566 RepID=A0ABR8NBZ8_9ACTN|nr:hypothetical protein [Nocardioides cavernae]MBD3925667.1 hypothetical protein [Nocardioides cavernae]MBM7513251.1 hypothetical protein [Nocardioides cavernae]
MNRPTIPLRLAGRPTRHRRVRHRPVALVLRRPPRLDPAAPLPTIRAGDQVAVTLAPRFTVVLQQFLAAAAVVDRAERPAGDGRRGAPGASGKADRSVVVHHHRTPALPWPGRSTTVLVERTTVALLLSRHAMSAPSSPAVPPQAWFGGITSAPTTQVARPQRGAPWRSDSRPAPSRSGPGPAYAVGLPVPRRRGTLDPSERRHVRRVTRDPLTREWAGGREGGGPPAPTTYRALPRVELALGASARQETRHVPRDARVATVYRQQPSTQVATPARPRTPALDAPVVRPTIDIDHLDRELWRRFEKRARTERERRGRA